MISYDTANKSVPPLIIVFSVTWTNRPYRITCILNNVGRGLAPAAKKINNMFFNNVATKLHYIPNMMKSASLPISIVPMRLSMPISFAGLVVHNFIALASGNPQNSTMLASPE